MFRSAPWRLNNRRSLRDGLPGRPESRDHPEGRCGARDQRAHGLRPGPRRQVPRQRCDQGGAFMAGVTAEDAPPPSRGGAVVITAFLVVLLFATWLTGALVMAFSIGAALGAHLGRSPRKGD